MRHVDLSQTLARGIDCHRRGQLAEAERCYRSVLGARHDHFDALRLLGAIKLQQGIVHEGASLLAAAHRVDPSSLEVLTNLGLCLWRVGRPHDALSCYDRALAVR